MNEEHEIHDPAAEATTAQLAEAFEWLRSVSLNPKYPPVEQFHAAALLYDISRLRTRSTRRGARMVLLREEIPPGTWQHLCDTLGAGDWFDDDGVPL